MKTHKPDGAVTLRSLHTSVNHPLNPGMGALHFVTTAQELATPAAKHRTIDWPASISLHPTFCSIGQVRHPRVFLSGNHQDLSNLCADFVVLGDSAWVKPCFREMLYTILDAQYVVDKLRCQSKCWKVVKGSGMGLTCSAEVSNAAFYMLTERNLLLEPDIRADYGILFYGRFHDDGLLILNCPQESRMELFRLMSVRSKFFELKIEEVSLSGLNMLDIYVHKGRGLLSSGCLDFTHFQKVTSIWRPLGIDSVHPRYMFTCHGLLP